MHSAVLSVHLLVIVLQRPPIPGSFGNSHNFSTAASHWHFQVRLESFAPAFAARNSLGFRQHEHLMLSCAFGNL